MLLFLILFTAAGGDSAKDEARKWLEEEVAYIISESEKREYEGLSTEAERAAFVEAFWQRRDPDPATEANPVREEHYRRLAYANQHFSEGRRGWRTDRGRVYVIHGEPDTRLVFPSTSLHKKKELRVGDTLSEGSYSGVTVAIPEAELWTYRARGAGSLFQEDTDVFFMRADNADIAQLLTLYTPGQSVIERDEFYSSSLYRGGSLTRDFRLVYAGRPRFNSNTDFFWVIESSPNTMESNDLVQGPANLLRSPGDLLEKELQKRSRFRAEVEAAVFFEEVPLALRSWFLPAADGYTQVPVALHVPGEALGSSDRLAVLVEARREGRTVAEVSEELELTDDPGLRRQGLTFQSRLVTRPGPHQLRAYVLDRDGGRLGRVERSLDVPASPDEVFALSPIMLCGEVVGVEAEEPLLPFRRTRGAGYDPWRVDQWLLVPRVDGRFRRKDTLTAYFQIFSPQLREHRPELDVELRLLQGGREVSTLATERLEYLTRDESTKLSYASSISLARLRPGRYQLVVVVRDRVSGEQASGSQDFEIL